MAGFLAAALAFPTVLFSFLLIVVVGYWLLVVFGAAAPDALDADPGEAGDGGVGGFLDRLGLGDVPATAVVSVLIAVAWFVSLAGTVALRAADLTSALAGTLLLVVALAATLLVTRLLVIPLRRMLPDGSAASRNDFVGRLCVIRTGRVGPDFGQAEVTAADGSSAIVQVRQAGDSTMAAGSTALIYDLDTDGGFFWVTPVDA